MDKSEFAISASTLIVTVLSPLLSGVPWLVSFPNSHSLLLYFHEVKYNGISNSITFFIPGQVHSYFPISYVFTKVAYLLIPSPTGVEFILPVLLQALLLLILVKAWYKRASGWTTPLLAIIAVSMGYFINGPFLWFRSPAAWCLEIFPIWLLLPDGRAKTATFVALAITMVLGDDGVISYAILGFITVALLWHKGNRYLLKYFVLLASLILMYGYAIGFIGASYYASYVPLIESEIASLFSSLGNTYGHAQTLGFPLYELYGQGISFLALYAIVPMAIFLGLKREGKAKRFMLVFVLICVGDLLRIANVLTPRAASAGALYSVVLDLLVPLGFFMIIFGRLSSNTSHVDLGISSRFLIGIILVATLTLTVFLRSPIVPLGPVSSASDPRVYITSNQVAGLFVGDFNGAVSVGIKADTTTLFQNTMPSQYIMGTSLPSGTFSSLNLSNPYYNIYYTNGFLVLVRK